MLFGNRTVERRRSLSKAGWETAFRFKSHVTGIASSILVYVDSRNHAKRITAALYANYKGRPGALVVAGSQLRPRSGAWNTVRVVGKHVEPKSYWIAVLGVGGTMYLRDRLNSGCRSLRARDLSAPVSSWQRHGSAFKACSLSAYVAGRRTATSDGNDSPIGTAASGVNAPASTSGKPVHAPTKPHPTVTSPPVLTTPPTISGTAVEGSTLTTNTGSWLNDPTSFAYKWQDCSTLGLLCIDISGANASSYALTLSDVGHTIRAVVTAINAGGRATATSVQTAVVQLAAPANATLPSITGPPAQGQTLATSNGSWANSPTSYSYAWEACDSAGFSCTIIPSATSSTHTLTASDIGHTIAVIVTAVNASGSASATSARTPIITPAPPADSTLPLITGTATQGEPLSVSNGSWSGSPTAYNYQWEACDTSGGHCTIISGATSAVYTVMASDVGATLRAVVTATNVGGSTSASSAPTDVVESASDAGGGGNATYSLPAARQYAWDPGLNPVGGIPDRTAVYDTISPSGGDDTATIQAALDGCPQNGVVQLAAGVFHISGQGLQFTTSDCTLRGTGPGPGTWSPGTAATGVGGTYLEKPSGTNYPVLTIGPQWGPRGPATELTSNAVRGTDTVTVASTSGLVPGQLVVVDEATGNTTVASASNGVNVDTFTGAAVLNVASTAHFISPGMVEVVTSSGSAVVSCTGTAGGNQFTGCTFTSGAAGTISTGNAVLDTTLAHWNSQDPENASAWFEEANRPLGDVMNIASINGNTLTFTTNFPITYDVSQSAHLYPLDNDTQRSGVEDVYVYGGEGGDGGGGIHIWNCAYCWVKHVEDTWSIGAAIHIDQSFGVEVDDSYLHDSENGYYSGGANYGVGLSWYTSNTLIQNNIIMDFNKVEVMRSSGGGNVFGYNYMDNGADLGGQWTEDLLDGNHMTTPHYELFEGNEAPNADTDDRWGNSIYITYFRNDLTGENRSFPGIAPIRGAGLTQWDWWYSFVGNVLGTPGDSNMTGYESINGGPAWTGNEWLLCYQNNDDAPDGGRCLASVLRDANFDYYTNEVHWHGIGGTGVNSGLTPPADSTLPDSMYLSSKPGFFGSNPWPWVNGSSATSPLPGQLPAYVRYTSGTPNAVQ